MMLFFLLAQRGLTASRGLQRQRPLPPSWPTVPGRLSKARFYYYLL